MFWNPTEQDTNHSNIEENRTEETRVNQSKAERNKKEDSMMEGNTEDQDIWNQCRKVRKRAKWATDIKTEWKRREKSNAEQSREGKNSTGQSGPEEDRLKQKTEQQNRVEWNGRTK